MGFLSPKVTAPPPRDYGKETRDTLQSQIDLAPDLYAAEASEEYGQPAYTRLGLRTLEESMLGGDGLKGLLRLYRDDINPQMAAMEAESNRMARESALADVERYGGRATEALLGADPMKKQLSDLMMQRQLEMEQYTDVPDSMKQQLSDAMMQRQLEIAQSQDILDPQLRREFQQSYRSGLGARGVAYSPYTVPQEAGFTAMQAEQMRRGQVQQQQQVLGQRQQMGQERFQRQQHAAAQQVQQQQQVLAQRQALAGDPFLQILGRPGQAFSASQGMGQQGFGVGQTAPRLFSPESQYGADLMAGNQSTMLSAQAAQAQARAGIMSGMFQGLGSLGGGFASRQ